MSPDVIGTIYQPTGVMLTDSEGNEYPEMEATPGYHVNTPDPVPEWDAYRVYPDAPARVYAGADPVPYTFPDQATFETEWSEELQTAVVEREQKAQAAEQARQEAKRHRDKALQSMTHTFSGGRTVQVRPQDLPNFQTAIARGAARNWVLADNTVDHLTVAELQEALASGIAQAELIWDQYMAEIA